MTMTTNNGAMDGGRETVVQFDHLQHVYPGGVEALKDINLSFRKGEIVAIIGQNGSGNADNLHLRFPLSVKQSEYLLLTLSC